jgi:hypothetical protein
MKGIDPPRRPARIDQVGAHAYDMVQYALGTDHTGPVECWLDSGLKETANDCAGFSAGRCFVFARKRLPTPFATVEILLAGVLLTRSPRGKIGAGQTVGVRFGLVVRNAAGVGSRFRAGRFPCGSSWLENDSRPLPQNATLRGRFTL